MNAESSDIVHHAKHIYKTLELPELYLQSSNNREKKKQK